MTQGKHRVVCDYCVSVVVCPQDVVQLNLTVNPSFKKGDSFEDTQAAEYVCPVTGIEMSGVYR